MLEGGHAAREGFFRPALATRQWHPAGGWWAQPTLRFRSCKMPVAPGGLPKRRGPFVEVGLGEGPDPVAEGGAAEGGEEEELEAEAGEFSVLSEAEKDDTD